MATQKHKSYHSYLLRLWQEDGGRHLRWRATLESVQSGEMYRFASLERLFAFLRRQAIAAARIDDQGDQAGLEK
ncbi:MAG: hypothetical protein H6632_15970 [Anaerolineales bacterium]|nr:hypothetical protein [Anaerolineales bacterium]